MNNLRIGSKYDMSDYLNFAVDINIPEIVGL